MDGNTLTFLVGLAAVIALVHTAMGPDHYVPFVAMAKAGGWSFSKTMWITLVCGVGHLLGSLALGMVAGALGWTLGGLEAVEAVRGRLAGWLLLGFGLAYLVWGVRRAIRNRPHQHLHVHADGTVHSHAHTHTGSHAHVHTAEHGPHPERGQSTMTAWMLFTIFVFGPCEPLVPLLMVPAAEHSGWGLVWVTMVFAAVTLVTMVGLVALGYFGVSRILHSGHQRYTHALAGLSLTLCGVAIMFGL